MKFFTTFTSVFVLLTAFQLQAQTLNNKPQNSYNAKTDFIKNQGYFSQNTLKGFTSDDTDSLSGFDIAAVKADMLDKGIKGEEYFIYLNLLKRRYIKSKYNLNGPSIETSKLTDKKLIGSGAVINATACINEGFEQTAASYYSGSNSISGWTLSSRSNDSQCIPTNWIAGSSEFRIRNTPFNDPNIGLIPHSPLGGMVIAQLNDSLAGTANMTKLAQNFSVTTANSFFQFAFAGFWEDIGHLCCDAPAFTLLVKDCAGNLLSCSSLSLTPTCSSIQTNYNITSYGTWTNWQVRSIDLTPYLGSCVTIEAIESDCAFGGHYGYLYFDAICGTQFTSIATSSLGISLGSQVNMCAGSSYATIQAPIGYATYSWVAAGAASLSASQASLSVLSLTNAIVGNTYTVYFGSSQVCQYSATYTLAYSSVGISAIGAIPSCSFGTSGSATVVGSGSGSGYTYSWTNSTNSIISTSSVISNVPAGNYSVIISAVGAPSCGVASSSVSILTAAQMPHFASVNFCGSEAYLSAPTGTNYQWYSGTSVISSTAGGIASSYTASPANSGLSYWVSYITTLGCRDSIRYDLTPIVNGVVTTSTNVTPCYLTANGSAVISLTPAPTATTAQNSFSIFSLGSTPTYTAYSGISPQTQYTATNLTSGTYSLIVSDGLCKYIYAFAVAAYSTIPFTLSPFGSPTICSGNYVSSNVLLPASLPPSQYTYSWSPANFLFSTSVQQNVITPTVSPGSSVTLVYSVVVTPTVRSCPETKTVSFTVVNVLPPLVNAIPQLCANSEDYQVTATPAGGIFSGNSALSSTGIISPSIGVPGINQFTYAITIGSCVASSSASFSIGLPPAINILGNTAFCEGQSATLSAAGATTYTWSTSSTSPTVTISPNTSTVYSVVGTDASTSCSSTAVITVTVLPLPIISITGPSSICVGETAKLSVSGCTSYVWNTSATDSIILVSPASSTVFSVKCTSTINACAGSNTHAVSVMLCTGLNNLSLASGLNVYPNPSSGEFEIACNLEISISVYDPLGKLLFEKQIEKENYRFDLSNYEDGIYILKITSAEHFKTLKLIKTP